MPSESGRSRAAKSETWFASQAPDGSGSLLFAPRANESIESFDANWSQDGFRHIRAVRRVEQM